jgi:hypothetical protein
MPVEERKTEDGRRETEDRGKKYEVGSMKRRTERSRSVGSAALIEPKVKK